jgi:hypothetical protein
MGRIAGWILVLVVGGGVAHAGGKHDQWKAVKRLGVGMAVEVRSVGQAGAEECRVVRVDDAALTCERERDASADMDEGDWDRSDTGGGARLVFPRDAVEGVWVWQDGSDRRMLIAMGIGFGIGALLCAEGGPAAAFICAGIGALIAAGVALDGGPAGPRWYPPGLPRRVRQREMVRQLVYRAPAAVTVSP